MDFNRILASVTCVAVAVLPVPALAASDHGNHHDHSAPQPAKAATRGVPKMVEGMVKKIDKAAGKVTLAHGPLVNLGMPAMTMVFRVKDNAWLGQMKEGDKINFIADTVNGAITVIRFESAK